MNLKNVWDVEEVSVFKLWFGRWEPMFLRKMLPQSAEQTWVKCGCG
jgi:hypothetical protein